MAPQTGDQSPKSLLSVATFFSLCRSNYLVVGTRTRLLSQWHGWANMGHTGSGGGDCRFPKKTRHKAFVSSASQCQP